MDLHENIFRIKTLMVEDKNNSIPNMIKTLGITDSIKYFGNYYTIEPYLKEIDKVNFIKDKVAELCDEFGGTGFGLVEINESPIFYNENEYELRQIEYLGTKRGMVDVYDVNTGSHIGDYSIPYESLPSQIIEELVEILLNH